jgi:hypothetical protein
MTCHVIFTLSIAHADDAEHRDAASLSVLFFLSASLSVLFFSFPSKLLLFGVRLSDQRQKKEHINTKLRIRQETQNGLFFRLLSETINRKFTRVSAKFSGERIFVCPTQRRTPHFFCTTTG